MRCSRAGERISPIVGLLIGYRGSDKNNVLKPYIRPEIVLPLHTGLLKTVPEVRYRLNQDVKT